MDILEYFELSNNGDVTGPVAYAPDGTSSYFSTLIEELLVVQQLPFPFTLHEVSVFEKFVKGSITNAHDDFQSNNLGLPLMSERMKQLIETEDMQRILNTDYKPEIPIDWSQCGYK